jgi:glutamate formiminotransferase
MPSPLIQSAINVSEGRSLEVIAAIVESAAETAGVTVADWSADADHNRMVVTLLGSPGAVARGAVAVAREAVKRIDLRHHTGAHPRLGAVDVIPLVPLRDVTVEECARVSREIARTLGSELELPVYLYEASAQPGRLLSLPDIRRGGFEGLFATPLTGLRAPDEGPAAPHPTAGAVVVGARTPLVAYNVNLDSPDAAVAKRIAARVRAERDSNPALAGVRALGLPLPSRGIAQVSLNLTMPDRTPLPGVFDFVRRAAAESGSEVRESEVIGLIPAASLGSEPPERILWSDYRESRILDYWMERL